MYIYKNVINANCLGFDDPFLASEKDSHVSYQEYKQQYKNELTPSRIKYTIFLKILHCYISKLLNKRS